MKVLLQRVRSASVTVGGSVVGQIDRGLLLLVGFGREDNSSKVKPAADKIVSMRIFSDDSGKFNLSLQDVDGALLVVPQFTLYADTSKGRRPEFFGAMDPRKARILFQELLDKLAQAAGKPIEKGEFGADMLVAIENDGPVTLMLES